MVARSGQKASLGVPPGTVPPRPYKLCNPAPEHVIRQVEALQRQRRTGQRVAVEIGLSPSTASRIFHRLRAKQHLRISHSSYRHDARTQQNRRDDPHGHQEVGRFKAPGIQSPDGFAQKFWYRTRILVCIDDYSRFASSVVILVPNPPYPYSTLHPESQRQGRTGYTNRSQGMGLWGRLPALHATMRLVAGMVALLQWAPTSQWFRKQIPIGRLEVDGNSLMNFYN